MLKFLCDLASKEPVCPLQNRISRKQQAIADREQELLGIAFELVKQEGFANLTMERLTKLSPYSKGTLYNHFCSREDVIVALCNAAMREELVLYRKARDFQGNSREKALAMHFAYLLASERNPVLFNCVLTAKSPFVQEKASQARTLMQQDLEKEITLLIDSLLAQAVAQQELDSPTESSLELMAFANWAMAFGGIALLLNARATHSISRLDGMNPFLFNLNTLLDGMQWRPLSTDFDYQHSWQRVAQEVFSVEMAELPLPFQL
ncbi:TetR/AcrR family transcriptional regulator [Rheinheimera sp.]|uniref:TetR/AcrR family transcriptional regulator n=1 Tax=Rheinheimera sp. TaxID=1869214 RepID=UPI00307EFFAB